MYEMEKREFISLNKKLKIFDEEEVALLLKEEGSLFFEALHILEDVEEEGGINPIKMSALTALIPTLDPR